MRKANIYELIDPITNEVRYIGKTTSPINNRLSAHIYEAKCGIISYKCNWIRKLLQENLHPVAKLIETVSSDNWIEREKYWILNYKKAGHKLTNLTEGGEGATGIKPTIESIEKRKNSIKANGGVWNKGLNSFDDDRILAGKFHPMYGKSPNNETRKKLRDSHMGLVSGMKGKRHTEKSKKLMSDNLVGNCHTQKTIEIIRQSAMNRKVSTDTRWKMSMVNTIIYTIINFDKDVYSFIGKKKLFKFFDDMNDMLPYKERISPQTLLIHNENKGWKVLSRVKPKNIDNYYKLIENLNAEA